MIIQSLLITRIAAKMGEMCDILAKRLNKLQNVLKTKKAQTFARYCVKLL
jgi:hypothetical protein